MKTFKFLFSMMLIIVGCLTANAKSTVTINPVSQQIRTYLSRVDFEKYIEKNTKFNISFLVTHQNEIIVVSTDNVQLDEVVKQTLNYQKIDMRNMEYNKIYTIPVNFR